MLYMTQADHDSTSDAELLDCILKEKKVYPVFQTIASLELNRVYGYEGLIRGPEGTGLHSPTELFDVAARCHRLAELEFLCRQKIIEAFVRLQLPGSLFINVSPITLLESVFKNGETANYLKAFNFDPARVVIEVTETQPIDDYELMRDALLYYRKLGYRVALDDLGAGYSGLRLWSEMHPDFVKVDRHFIENVNGDKKKKQFIQAIIEIAISMGCQTIMEGIETQEECRTLRKLGANLVQGFYFAKPRIEPPAQLNPALFYHERLSIFKVSNKPTAVCLLRECVTVSPELSTERINDIFSHDPKIASLAVVSEDEVLGMVVRLDFFNLFARRFGRELHGRKPIYLFTNQNVVIVDVNTPLERLSKLLTNAKHQYIDEFLITREGKLVGKGTLVDLLKRITEYQVTQARYSNPLTLLPGNVPIQQIVDEKLSENISFIAAYCDLDYFKPYNDVYGYARGDDIIRYVASLLRSQVDEEQDFVGHIGGDDFMVIFTCHDWIERCQRILDIFQKEIVNFYNIEHRNENPGIAAWERYGDQKKFPQICLSIGAVTIPACSGLNRDSVADLVTQAKSRAKKMQGNSLVVISAPTKNQVEDAQLILN